MWEIGWQFYWVRILLSRHNPIRQVDLAGSERVGKSGVVGDQLKEAQHINKSLSSLEQVRGSVNRSRSAPAAVAAVAALPLCLSVESPRVEMLSDAGDARIAE